ncbi:hypothetical protein K1719_018460 [Acacia pycnantha]|nr:hypothetical protein K1719_018460 [Acacia pycnantha]
MLCLTSSYLITTGPHYISPHYLLCRENCCELLAEEEEEEWREEHQEGRKYRTLITFKGVMKRKAVSMLVCSHFAAAFAAMRLASAAWKWPVAAADK